jgi:HD-GYP domain-containing protein (c-di-GMP phosphodiesterase class II)
MNPERTLEVIVFFVLLAALIAATVAWIRARDKLHAPGEAHAPLDRRFRRRLQSLHAARDIADTKELVLRTAIELLEADRGLLLGRDDRDGDGNLDVICAIGFAPGTDPESDPFVQRIGAHVLERDETVREASSVAMPVYIADEFDGALVCAKDNGDFGHFDDEVLLALGDHAGAVLGTSRLQGDLRSAYVGTVRALADAIEAKDPSVRSHSEEVARYSAAVAARLDLDEDRREELLFGSLLHDVGKIGISERILLKPARLTPDEFDVIKLHPGIGHRLVMAIPSLAGVAPAILHHHERYDGKGYPSGLAGEDIPLEARIIGVADSFSAMVADRPYSRGRSHGDACAELERCAGTQFDPTVVSLFVEEVRRNPPDHVEPFLLLHSAPFLLERADAEARRAELQGGTFGVIAVDFDGRPSRVVADAVHDAAVAAGGIASRLDEQRLAVLVPGAVELVVDHLEGELGEGARIGCAAWQPGEGGAALVDRVQRTMNENRAIGTAGRP